MVELSDLSGNPRDCHAPGLTIGRGSIELETAGTQAKAIRVKNSGLDSLQVLTSATHAVT